MGGHGDVWKLPPTVLDCVSIHSGRVSPREISFPVFRRTPSPGLELRKRSPRTVLPELRKRPASPVMTPEEAWPFQLHDLVGRPWLSRALLRSRGQGQDASYLPRTLAMSSKAPPCFAVAQTLEGLDSSVGLEDLVGPLTLIGGDAKRI